MAATPAIYATSITSITHSAAGRDGGEGEAEQAEQALNAMPPPRASGPAGAHCDATMRDLTPNSCLYRLIYPDVLSSFFRRPADQK